MIEYLAKALGPVTTIAEGAGKALGDVIIKAVDAVFDCCDTYKVGENGAFPPTRDGCIHSLSMRERG